MCILKCGNSLSISGPTPLIGMEFSKNAVPFDRAALFGGMLMILMNSSFAQSQSSGQKIFCFIPESRAPFSEMDVTGHVYHELRLPANISVDGIELPLKIVFDAKTVSSSTLGTCGWSFPIFDSNVAQIDEQHFQVLLPDGKILQLQRDMENTSVLHGFGGWAGYISPKEIALSNAGGDKILFRNGRISSWETKGNKFSYSVSNLTDYQLTKNGRLILQTKPISDSIVRIVADGYPSIDIAITKAPRVGQISGKNVVTSLVRSISSVFVDGKAIERLDYSVDESGYPTVKINSMTEIRWNPINRLVRSVNDTDYESSYVGGSPSENRHLKIVQRNTFGGQRVFEEESDGATTQNTSPDGHKVTITTFTSGILKGKLKSFIKEKSGALIERKTIAYNEFGNPIRETTVDGTGQNALLKYKYNATTQDLETVTLIKDEKIIMQYPLANKSQK